MTASKCGPYEITRYGARWAITAGSTVLLIVDAREEAMSLARRARSALREPADRVAPEPRSFAPRAAEDQAGEALPEDDAPTATDRPPTHFS